jgi:hypothetical protein
MADEQQQGNIKIEFNTASSGMNMDQSVNQIQKGQLSYALNAALENFDANSTSYQNEPGNEFCLEFPKDYHVIGEHFINEKNKHIFFLVNPGTGGSEIGYMDNNDCIYHTYINAPCLNFNIDNPIHKAVHKITSCTTEIYWTDGLNPRRFLDLDNIPYVTTFLNGVICDAVSSKEIDCNKLNIQPNFEIPSLRVVDIVTGGALIAGTYQFAIQYCDATGSGYTSYYSVTNPTPIANPQTVTLNFNYEVGRSIVIDIANLDVTGYYQYYNLAVIKTINDITSVELVGTYFINSLTDQITYSGQNQTQIRLTVNDIFEKFPYYEIAQDLTAVQDVLVWDNLTSIDRINYQQIASGITLQWQTYRIPNTETYADELNATNLRGYLRDEVYAFEIVFLLKNGKQTDGFHIPGRVKSYSETSHLDVSTLNNDFIGEPEYYQGSVGYSPYWKIYNTASVLGDSPEYIAASNKNTTYKGPYQYGEFAYWESTEEYPCNTDVWGDLAGQKIRHHKMPDVLVSPIFESPTIVLNPGGFYDVQAMVNDAIFPLGVKLDVQQITQLIAISNLTQEQKDNIAAFKIVRGNRGTNRSIVAKGILRNVGKYNREGTDYYYPNYPYNDTAEDPFILTKSNAFNDECLTFRVVTTVAGKISYLDCFTNSEKIVDVSIGEISVCSLTVPISISGTSTFAQTNSYTYTLTSAQFNSFGYEYPQGVFLIANVSVGEVVKVESVSIPRVLGSNPWPGFGIEKVSFSNSNCLPTNLDGFGAVVPTPEPKYRHVFNSPETNFAQPFLGDILKIESVMFGAGRSHFVKVREHATYKLLSYEAQRDALGSSSEIANITGVFNASVLFAAYQAYLAIYINGITRKNYAQSFNSIANYDYSNKVENDLGIKQRPLDIKQYMIPGFQSVTDDRDVNNFSRESSVYLKTADTRFNQPIAPLPFPNKTPSILRPDGQSYITDNSRFSISQRGNCGTPENQVNINVVSYYGSLKNVFVNQWGQMYSYETIDTGFQRNIEPMSLSTQSSEATIFGGDTFISRFAFKTKLPFFIDNRVGAPDDSDVFYDEIGNIAYPKYWFSSRSILSDWSGGGVNFKNLVSYKAHNFDCPNSQQPPAPNPNRTYYDGYFYLFAYGIPNFYCESSYNVDLRQAFNNKEGDFWPHVATGIPDNWLQENYVPIIQDNTYYYNVTFSKQNKENFFSHLPIDWKQQLCYTNFPFRAIYSDAQDSYTADSSNSWLIYRPISFFDFPQNYGNLTSLDGIQNKAILARFENKSLLYNTMLTVSTSNPQAAYLGNSTLFKSAPPIDFAETDLGYVGSQNKFLLKIPQGQVTIDAKRGQVFLISGAAKDISSFGSGLNRFFTDHLAFEILRYFPTVDTDNHFNGVGLHGVFDSKYDRVIISKLDYIPLSTDIKYDDTTKEFYINRIFGTTTLRQVVSLTDSDYFCSKSWTLSFNLNTNTWVSFHSYVPNFYVGENNFFYSGMNTGCDFEAAIASYIVPTPSTTSTTTSSTSTSTTSTTTTIKYNCALDGNAVLRYCDLEGNAIEPYCRTYIIENVLETSLTFDYLDCDGNPVSYSVPPGGILNACTIDTIFATIDYNVGFVGDGCIPPNSAEICIGDGCLNACACGTTVTVYYLGTFDAGTTLYTDATLITPYTTPPGLDNISYAGICYTLAGSTLVYNSDCA